MEELRNEVKVVIRALDTGMPHVSAEVWEHGVDINTGGDPPVQITECEVMPEVVRPWLVAASLLKTCGLPDFAKYYTHVCAVVAF